MLYCFVHSCFNNYRKCFFITLFINPFADVQKKIPLPSWKKKTFSPDEEIFVTNFFLAVYLALLQILYFFAYCSVVDIVLSIILYCCTSCIFAYFVLLYNMNCSSSCIDKDFILLYILYRCVSCIIVHLELLCILYAFKHFNNCIKEKFKMSS